MPVVFAGHGSPMSAIENNAYTAAWEKIGKELPRPRAILSVSAHWFTRGTRVQTDPHPQQIYDMYGFPPELYHLKYPVSGSAELGKKVLSLIHSVPVQADNSWGIDHGTWAVLCKMFPKADIPVVQLSVDGQASPSQHYAVGQELRSLREEDVLIFASGDVVHNLSLIDWDKTDGYEWADTFDTSIRDKILAHDFQSVVNYSGMGESARLSVPSPDHFSPLLYALGAADSEDRTTVFNDFRTLGSLSMTGYIFSAA